MVTPLFRRALRNAADDRVARLKKFYEISVRKEVLSQESGYTKRGREIEKGSPMILLASFVGSAESDLRTAL